MTEATDTVIAAFESHDWGRVVEALEGLDYPSHISSDDLTRLADSLFWVGRFDDSVDTFEKAFSSLVNEGRVADAGKVAALLAYVAFRRRAYAVANGWQAQAEALLEGQPESMGHAWIKIMQMGKAIFVEGNLDGGVEIGDEAIRISREVGSRSAESLALSFKALGMIHNGEWREGMGLIDTSMGMAMAGDDLRMTSDVYCNTISSCRNLGDYQRAAEWNEEAERWMRMNSVGGYTGACQVHRAELKRLHGSWLEAEDEARNACVQLERFHLADYLGAAHYEIGEIRRRMGDLNSAETAFEKAYEHGHDAQPGISLLMKDRGDAPGALKSITRAIASLATHEDNPLSRGPSRARLLPALIEIALAAGDYESAQEWISQLDVIANAYESHVWKAAAASSLGGLQLATGEHNQAIETLGKAWRMWSQADLPYEMGRARSQLGEARLAVGDETGARLEFKAARSVLEELGAVTETRHIDELMGREIDHRDVGAGNRVTRTFMFTDIVTSTDLIELIGDSSWQDLLKWHDKTLRAAIETAGGEVVRHTGDGFFASFGRSRAGVECAVDIQRRLAAHRRQAGFAPLVRIGLHRTEATRTHGDYTGGGIHLASRIGDFGSGEEVVVSSATLTDAGKIPYSVTDPIPVELKGIKYVVDLQKIDWR